MVDEGNSKAVVQQLVVARRTPRMRRRSPPSCNTGSAWAPFCSYARTPSQTIAPGLGGGPAEAQWRTGNVNTRQQRPRWHTVMQPVPSQSCARGPLRRTLERAQMPSSWPCRPSLDSSLGGGLVQLEQETTRVSPAELRMRRRTFARQKSGTSRSTVASGSSGREPAVRLWRSGVHLARARETKQHQDHEDLKGRFRLSCSGAFSSERLVNGAVAQCRPR